MSAQPLISRVEALTRSLNPAVQKAGGSAGGAEFAWLLSLISESGSLAERLERQALPAAPPVELGHYTPEVIGRLHQAVAEGHRGELGLMLSWLETAPVRSAPVQPEMQEPSNGVALPMAQAALLGQRYGLLDEITQSRVQISA